jgi:DNA integrity scanning protein DisA with diadenylate cyclase activity
MKLLSKIAVFLLLVNVLNADIVQDYLDKNYKKICSFKNIKKYKSNEKALSIIGVSCTKVDSIYLLPYIINELKYTNYGRKNAIYFITILMEKKLLYSFLYDNISLDAFSFPMTDYVLSKIFDAIKHRRYKKIGDLIVIEDKKSKTTYNVYKKNDRFFIDEFKNGKLIKRRWYR